MLSKQQKLIILADKSEFGWKTIEEYVQRELADAKEDAKRIRHAEDRAEKALKSSTAKKSSKHNPSAPRPSGSDFWPPRTSTVASPFLFLPFWSL